MEKPIKKAEQITNGNVNFNSGDVENKGDQSLLTPAEKPVMIFPITSLPCSKQAIAEFANRIKHAIKEGEIDALNLLRFLKGAEKLHEAVKPILDKHAIAEAEKYSSKEEITPYAGCEFKVRDNSRWKYDHCNDDEYNSLKAIEADIKESIKKREIFLQSLSGPTEIVNEDTGEVKTVNPAIKVGGSSIVTTFL